MAKEPCFALKGGTAINLFIRNLPRLSVDIDLTYLPVAERGQSLSDIDIDIDIALKNIGKRIRKANNSIHITESAPRSQNEITKRVVRTKKCVQIKIGGESLTLINRGKVHAFRTHRMGDTLSFKITEKIIDLEHLSRSRYGSTDVLG